MRVSVGESAVELVQGDITAQQVTAIVNAANSQLAGGGGVDGAVHRNGGPTIMAETAERYPDGCPTGSAVISAGGQLSADFVIHAVGPIWRGGQHGEAVQLASAYLRCLQLASEHGCESIALPALSTGAYRYPIEPAARVALLTAIDFLSSSQSPLLTKFVLFDSGAYQVFVTMLQQLAGDHSLEYLDG